MSEISGQKKHLNRRTFLRNSALATGALAAGTFTAESHAAGSPRLSNPNSAKSASILAAEAADRKAPTRFIHSCVTRPFRFFPLDRALRGIKNAGFDSVTWGIHNREDDGEYYPVMPVDAPPRRAAELGRRCRDMGLEPSKIFSHVYPDDPDAIEKFTNRILQAAAAEIPYILTYGATRGGDPELWVRRFKELGPIAADHNVTLLMKQHGGVTTGTGEALARIIREVNHPHVLLSYDAGNVNWYLDLDPIPDIHTCSDLILSFCLKDARMWPEKATNGPGFGEIDHYRLLEPVAFTGKTIVLAYENIYPPYIGNPSWPEQVEEWGRLSKVYMEMVIRGIQSV